MHFQPHSPNAFFCSITRNELKKYDIDMDEIRPENSTSLSEKMNMLMQDVLDCARREINWNPNGMIDMRAYKTTDDQLVLEVRKQGGTDKLSQRPSDKETVNWEIIDTVTACKGFALYFADLSLAAAYLRATKDAMDANLCIFPTLYHEKNGYILDVSYDVNIAEGVGEKDDKHALRHVISTATEYADRICSGEKYLLIRSSIAEHTETIASYSIQFDLIRRFGMP